MKNTERLSLTELKAKADQANVVEKLEAIKGQGMMDCHGWWGSVEKALVGSWQSTGGINWR
jgi:hypothetical protein